MLALGVNNLVSLLQAPEGETQPSTEVDLFISTEKIMVLNTDLKVSIVLVANVCMYRMLWI